MNRREAGREGEARAANFLHDLGYEILDKNFTAERGEVDIIAETPDRQGVVFVEVKTWQSYDIDNLEYALNYRKIRAVKRASAAYLASKAVRTYQFIRYDVIFIQHSTVHHLEGAF